MTIAVDKSAETVVEMGFIKEATETALTEYVCKILDEICERYVIGIEEGKETGYKHLQCRIVTRKDTVRPQDWALYFRDKGLAFHMSPSHVRDFAYCEKEGRFIRSWETVLSKYVNVSLDLWQIMAMDMWKKQSDREILVIRDMKGAHGKTFLRKHLIATHQATFIPPMEKAEDIMAMGLAKPAKGYVIDLPKAEGKVKTAMWSAIEQLKDGYIYDKRYSFKEKWIEPPKIMVFCNYFDSTKMSEDRWNVLDITDFKQRV